MLPIPNWPWELHFSYSRLANEFFKASPPSGGRELDFTSQEESESRIISRHQPAQLQLFAKRVKTWVMGMAYLVLKTVWLYILELMIIIVQHPTGPLLNNYIHVNICSLEDMLQNDYCSAI